jgi:hypothetical protein
MPLCKKCTGTCTKPPYTTTGLTHDSGYPSQLRYNWGYNPRIFDAWKKLSEENSWDKTAEKIRKNILENIKNIKNIKK